MRLLQWLCVPFALTHEAVGSLSATKDKWIGSLEIEDAAMFTDIYLLLIFGGIPWQVRKVFLQMTTLASLLALFWCTVYTYMLQS